MRQLTIILTLFSLLMSLPTNGQTGQSYCDTFFDFAEKMPQYNGDVKGLMDYLMRNLTPILSDCYSRDSILTASIHLVLTIDKQGQVIDVNFERIQATDNCKQELRQEIMLMSGWTPGRQDGVPVCSKFYWPINCINWK